MISIFVIPVKAGI